MLRFRQFIMEGGNAIRSSSRINQDNVMATLKDIEKRLFPKLKIKKSETSILGSTGKKKSGDSSGDIDLAIDANAIIKHNKIKIPGDVFNTVVSVSKKLSKEVKDSRGVSVISLAWPIKNVDGNQKGQVVQLDLMIVDNLKFSTFAFWSPSFEESKWKGLHRNHLLIAIANAMEFTVVKTALDAGGVEVPVQFQRNFFNMRKGLMRGLQSIEGKDGRPVKTKKTISSVVVADEPVAIVKILLGPGFSVSNAVSFESVWKAMHNSKFIHKSQLSQIKKVAAQGILSAGATLPSELENA